MLKENDIVLYGTHGVCNLQGTTEKRIGGKKIVYYVLKPVYQQSATIFVPIDNTDLTEKIRRVLTKEEIYSLVENVRECNEIWIEDDYTRKAEYAKIIQSGDREKLIQIIKLLSDHRCSQIEKGRKFHRSDEEIFKDAEKILYDEFAVVLGIKPSEVLEFIKTNAKHIQH